MNHANNLALIEVSKVWEIDGDWMRCRACRAVLIASRDGEPLRHKTECKNAAHVHPWSDLRKAMDVTPVQTGAVGSVPGWKRAADNLADAVQSHFNEPAGFGLDEVEAALDHAEASDERVKNALAAYQELTRTPPQAVTDVGGGWQPIETLPEKGENERFDVYLSFDTGEVKLASWVCYIERSPEFHASTGVYLGQSIQGGDACYMTDDGYDVRRDDDGRWFSQNHPTANIGDDGRLAPFGEPTPFYATAWMEALKPTPTVATTELTRSPQPVGGGECTAERGAVSGQDSDSRDANSCPEIGNCALEPTGAGESLSDGGE